MQTSSCMWWMHVNPQMDEQMYIVYETLMKLEVKNKPVITAFNNRIICRLFYVILKQIML